MDKDEGMAHLMEIKKMKTPLICAFLLLASPALGQTMYKCPDPAGVVKFQQMPCTPQGGGEQVTITPHSPPSRNDSVESVARIQAYLNALQEERKQKQDSARDEQDRSPSMTDQVAKIKAEERAKECYALEKRIYYIQQLERNGAHIRYGSIGDEDSRAAIEQYKRQCGAWR